MSEKSLRWLHGQVKTPPMSTEARREVGILLRELQNGEILSMPHSRPMPAIGLRCHELRVNERTKTWRVVYRIDTSAIVILDVHEKKTRVMPKAILETCRKRLKNYEASFT